MDIVIDTLPIKVNSVAFATVPLNSGEGVNISLEFVDFISSNFSSEIQLTFEPVSTRNDVGQCSIIPVISIASSLIVAVTEVTTGAFEAQFVT